MEASGGALLRAAAVCEAESRHLKRASIRASAIVALAAARAKVACRALAESAATARLSVEGVAELPVEPAARPTSARAPPGLADPFESDAAYWAVGGRRPAPRAEASAGLPLLSAAARTAGRRSADIELATGLSPPYFVTDPGPAGYKVAVYSLPPALSAPRALTWAAGILEAAGAEMPVAAELSGGARVFTFRATEDAQRARHLLNGAPVGSAQPAQAVFWVPALYNAWEADSRFFSLTAARRSERLRRGRRRSS